MSTTNHEEDTEQPLIEDEITDAPVVEKKKPRVYYDSLMATPKYPEGTIIGVRKRKNKIDSTDYWARIVSIVHDVEDADEQTNENSYYDVYIMFESPKGRLTWVPKNQNSSNAESTENKRTQVMELYDSDVVETHIPFHRIKGRRTEVALDSPSDFTVEILQAKYGKKEEDFTRGFVCVSQFVCMKTPYNAMMDERPEAKLKKGCIFGVNLVFFPVTDGRIIKMWTHFDATDRDSEMYKIIKTFLFDPFIDPTKKTSRRASEHKGTNMWTVLKKQAVKFSKTLPAGYSAIHDVVADIEGDIKEVCKKFHGEGLSTGGFTPNNEAITVKWIVMWILSALIHVWEFFDNGMPCAFVMDYLCDCQLFAKKLFPKDRLSGSIKPVGKVEFVEDGEEESGEDDSEEEEEEEEEDERPAKKQKTGEKDDNSSSSGSGSSSSSDGSSSSDSDSSGEFSVCSDEEVEEAGSAGEDEEGESSSDDDKDIEIASQSDDGNGD